MWGLPGRSGKSGERRAPFPTGREEREKAELRREGRSRIGELPVSRSLRFISGAALGAKRYSKSLAPFLSSSGMVMPIAAAVFRLKTGVPVVTCWIGVSAGFFLPSRMSAPNSPVILPMS